MGIYRCPFKSSTTGNSLLNFYQILKWLLIILIQFSFIMILCKMIYAGENKLMKRAEADLRAWKIALDIYYVDWIKYPKANSIEEIGRLLESSGYWERPIVKDPWGNLYQYSASSNVVEIKSLGEDGIISSYDIMVQPGFKALQTESLPMKGNAIAKFYPAKYNSPILNPGTIITLSKSGNNVIITWTEVPPRTYDVVRATDKQFFNAVTLALDLIGSSYTYINGLINNRNIEFFDVTDDTETNRGSENNGGDPPPQPPVITISPTVLYIGLSAIVQGTGFSSVKDDNSIWFSGGVKANVTNATATQLDFIVPAGAVSGNYYVTIGGALTSEPISAPVFLDDSAQPWTTARTIGYSELTGSYWGGGNWGGNRLVEMKYNNSTGKWEKSNKTGSDQNFIGYMLYCSTNTDSSGRIFCAKANLSVSAARTGYADTVAETNLQNCRILSPDGEKQQHVIRAAADPDPNRNVAYFAYQNVSDNLNYIMKVSSNCSSILDTDYGNTNGTVFSFPSIVGMAVDRDGVLYISEGSQITKIWQDEYGEHYEPIKTGFNNLLGIDVKQASPGSPVFIIGAEFGASRVIAFSTDNLSAPVNVIASGSGINARTVAWSQSVFDEWSDIKRKRNTWVYNRGNTLISIEGDYRLIVEPVTMEEGRAWISSPVASDMAPYQTWARASDPAATGYSTIVVRAWWRDGIARQLCAYSGDPRSSAPYEPAPSDTTLCDRPRDIAGAICDNKEDFSSTGPGSFVINNSYNYCFPLGCGTDRIHACEIELRISQRYAGDNYKVYFEIQDEVAQQTIAQATGNLTAWKHAHIEKDKMCRKGGLLFDSYGATGKCGGSGQPPCCGTGSEPPCHQIVVYYWHTVSIGDSIKIFDEINTAESGGEERKVNDIVLGTGGRSYITLDAPLTNNYFAAYNNGQTPPTPTFENEHSAGIGQIKDSSDIPCNPCFYEAETSDISQPFNDAFASFHVPMDSPLGAGAVPYINPSFFDPLISPINIIRFHNVWFANRQLIACPTGGTTECQIAPPECQTCCNEYENYYHVIPNSGMLASAYGKSCPTGDVNFIFSQRIIDQCGSTANCVPNLNCSVLEHGMVHLYDVNMQSPCANGHDPGEDSDEFNWAWCGAIGGSCAKSSTEGTRCLMSGATDTGEWEQDIDEINRLDCEELAGIALSCGIQSCGGVSIRTQQDPY